MEDFEEVKPLEEFFYAFPLYHIYNIIIALSSFFLKKSELFFIFFHRPESPMYRAFVSKKNVHIITFPGNKKAGSTPARISLCFPFISYLQYYYSFVKLFFQKNELFFIFFIGRKPLCTGRFQAKKTCILLSFTTKKKNAKKTFSRK